MTTRRLNEEQRKWIEDNYDLVDIVVARLVAECGTDEDTIRSIADEAICDVVLQRGKELNRYDLYADLRERVIAGFILNAFENENFGETVSLDEIELMVDTGEGDLIG